MSLVYRSVVNFSRKHPISRGMLAYAILWPTSNIVQQALIRQRPEGIDWKETLRFSFFGCTYVAPSIYVWVKIIGYLLPGTTFKTAVAKVSLFSFICTYS